jgi:hypothetical protein
LQQRKVWGSGNGVAMRIMDRVVVIVAMGQTQTLVSV